MVTSHNSVKIRNESRSARVTGHVAQLRMFDIMKCGEYSDYSYREAIVFKCLMMTLK